MTTPDLSAKTRAISAMRYALFCAALVFSILFIGRIFLSKLGHDQSSYLSEADRMVAGNELYGPRISETNPPLIVWFSSVPVRISQWTHVSAVVLLKLIVLGMLFGSVAWCFSILLRSRRWGDPISPYLCTFGILFAEFIIDHYEFAQREHLLLLLLLPYIIAAATEVGQNLRLGERLLLGIAAGFAVWFKPQDILIVVALEIFLVIRHRSLKKVLRSESILLTATCLLLLICVRVFTPLYFTTVYPLLTDVYWAMGTHSALAAALFDKVYLLVLCVALVVCLVARRRLHDPAGAAALLVCSFAASVASDVQHTTWTYHRYPHEALLYVALTYLIVDLCSPLLRWLSQQLVLTRIMAVASSAFAVIFICAVALRPYLLRPGHSPENEADKFLEQLTPGTTVSVLSTNVSPMADAYNLHLVWGSRFAHLWMLPAIMQNELGPSGPPAPFKRLSTERLSQLSTLLRSEVAEDLDYWHPSVVLVQHCSQKEPCQGFEGKDVDLSAWFLRNPEFAAAWSRYQRETTMGGWDVYRLTP